MLEFGLTDLEALNFPVESTRFIADGHAIAASHQQLELLAKTGGQFLTYLIKPTPRISARYSIYRPCSGCAERHEC